MPSGLVTTDRQGRVTFVNRAGRIILGLPPEGPIWQELEGIFPGIHTLNSRSRRHELVVDTPAGERILGLTVANFQQTSEGLLIVFQDLTDLRRAERELRRVDQLAALGTFSAQLAHEIRNPLAAMRGAAQLLAQEDSQGQDARLITILLREADRLSLLVENFLRFARPPDPKLEMLDLSSIVAETLEMMRMDNLAEGVQVSSDLTPVVAPVDPSQLRQVLLNLLRNAFGAVQPHGQVRVAVTAEQDRVRIRVWDSAGAIPEDHLGRIFEPFFTTRQGGTGLGLSTAHSIVRAHQGQIHVTSSPDEGTEFILELPMQEARLASTGR
jgi:two-component system sensor histidine kinase PilS (NtrC family)